jgi:hypothetical protein
VQGHSQRVSEADSALWGERIKVLVLPVPFSGKKTRRTPHSSAWLPRHLRTYWLNIDLSVLDFPGRCIYLFVMAMGEEDHTGTIPRFSNGYPK